MPIPLSLDISWIRYLLEAATGVFTGSIFNDGSIVQAGHYGESRNYNDGSTLLQKTHHSLSEVVYQSGLEWRQKHIRQFGGRGVLVIRNPYKAIISYYNFKQTGGSHTETVAAERFRSAEFREFVRVGAVRWLELIHDWLEFSTDCHIIMYEVSQSPPLSTVLPASNVIIRI